MANISAKKSLGQNFLKDENILRKIANSFDVTEKDLIIEIGPGMGALTKYLIQKSSDLICYEIDERLKDTLLSFSKENVQIIFDDFLKRNLKEDLQRDYGKIYVIANIPYYITTPIIEHILASGLIIHGMTLLVQKEVALRFSAKPGAKDYGYFTVFLQHYFSVQKLFDVHPYSFSPPPKVMSSVVQLIRKDEIVKLDETKFFAFLKMAFHQKRKTLKNNLQGYDWSKIVSVLEEFGYPLTVRAEEISYETFVQIFRNLF